MNALSDLCRVGSPGDGKDFSARKVAFQHAIADVRTRWRAEQHRIANEMQAEIDNLERRYWAGETL